jgi:hypothetical protein
MMQVFENLDLLSLIIENLEYPEISNVMCINKLFYKTGKQHYNVKYDQVNSAVSSAYLDYVNDRKKLINASEYDRSYQFTLFMQKLVSIKLFWTIILHKPLFMKNLFHTAAHYHKFRYRIPMNIYTGIHDKIRPYLYIENPDMYIVKELKDLLEYKQIRSLKCKPVYKLKRTKLIKELQEPLHKIFALTHFEDNIKEQQENDSYYNHFNQQLTWTN